MSFGSFWHQGQMTRNLWRKRRFILIERDKDRERQEEHKRQSKKNMRLKTPHL